MFVMSVNQVLFQYDPTGTVRWPWKAIVHVLETKAISMPTEKQKRDTHKKEGTRKGTEKGKGQKRDTHIPEPQRNSGDGNKPKTQSCLPVFQRVLKHPSIPLCWGLCNRIGSQRDT
jgi:hypothetical protein